MVVQETKADLVELAGKANPVVKFFDPLGLSTQSFWGQSESATIGWLRASEIKHGRIAMFAFCGFIAGKASSFASYPGVGGRGCFMSDRSYLIIYPCLPLRIAGSNGFTFPWAMELDGTPFPSAGGVPGAQWDALSFSAKVQIISFIALMELWSEGVGTHYMKGGQPGKFPSFKDSDVALPHPVPFDLFDPFGFSKNASAEKKAAGLVKEINNGRLAQIGLFGFLAESKVEGSVPALTGLIKHYDGDYMAPFSG